jgi:hypothetical protein
MIKKTFLLLFLSVITFSVFAQTGSMTVASNSNQKFWLFIDDVLQNEYSTHSIKIMGMQFMPYKVRVEMDNPANNCVGQIIVISRTPQQNNFVVSMDRMNNFLFGMTNQIPNPFFIQNIILPNYQYYNSFQQYLFPGFNPNVSYGQGNQYRGSKYKGYNYQNNQGGQGYGGNQGHGGNHGGNQGYGQGSGKPSYNGAMPNNDFNNALSVIRKESFDSSKLATAKQVTATNYLSVNQIVQICRLFSFESSKLDYAKFAYNYCVDKNNYFQVNEVFNYTSSKDELRKYIGGR